jgi:hypothetical protein
MAGFEAGAGDIVAVGAEWHSARRSSVPATMSTMEMAGNAGEHQGSIGGPESWLNDLVGLENGNAVPASSATAAAVLASILAVLAAYIYAGRTYLGGRPLYSLNYVPIYPPS